MFNSSNKNASNMAKIQEVETPSINIIGAGTSIKGEIISNGDIRIDGNIQGTVKTKGKLIIGSNGNVEGEFYCTNGDFQGIVNGKINVTELLILKSTCKLNGDIVTNKLAIEPGAVFTGSCRMNQNVSAQYKNEKSETNKEGTK